MHQASLQAVHDLVYFATELSTGVWDQGSFRELLQFGFRAILALGQADFRCNLTCHVGGDVVRWSLFVMASRAQVLADHEPASIQRYLKPAERSKLIRKEKRNAPNKLACYKRKSASEIDSTLEDTFNDLQLNSREADANRAWWSIIPVDIQDLILSKFPYKHLFQAKAASKLFKTHIDSDGFHGFRGRMHHREGLLTALHFSVRNHGVWQCAGYDLTSNSWKKLPPFQMLPRLDPALFKDHSICGAGGIMCANVSTSASTHAKMVVFNPLTGRWKELPPLNHPRNPVLMQMVVDSGGDSYKIIVAGSARAGHREHLSKVTEVFDSRTSMWIVTQALPGPLFALDEHQTGVYMNGILYCIAFLEGRDSGKGVLAFSVDEGKWLPHLSCPLPNSTNLKIAQLVESNGEVVVFSVIEHNLYIDRNVEHRIDSLEEVMLCTNLRATNLAHGSGKWRKVMSELKVGSQAGLQVYPEYTCVPFGEGKLCIFNTVVHTGIVYDVQSGNRIQILSSPIWRGSEERGFCSMNPLTFSFEPSFKGKP